MIINKVNTEIYSVSNYMFVFLRYPTNNEVNMVTCNYKWRQLTLVQKLFHTRRKTTPPPPVSPG
jgi:hypothetical protein